MDKMVALLKGAVFVLVLVAVAYFGTLSFLTSFVPLIAISWSLSMRCLDYVACLWMALVPALLELLLGVRVRLSGEEGPVKGPCLIIMNHRTRFDWMFIWCYLFRLGGLTRHKIILKTALKKIPYFGWAMQSLLFLFLSRRWEDDEQYMTDRLAYFVQEDYPVQLLIFPEGSDLSESNREKSHRFAEKNGLTRYNYVLHPRTKGFTHTVQELRKGTAELTILNVCVAYVGHIPQNERDIALGRFPDEIHFHGKLVPPSEIPEREEDLDEWLKKCWQEKEQELETFYATKHFNSPYWSEAKLHRQWGRLVGLLILWSLFLLVHIYSFIQFSAVRWAHAILSVVYFAVVHLTPGLDYTLLQLYQHKQRKQQ